MERLKRSSQQAELGSMDVDVEMKRQRDDSVEDAAAAAAVAATEDEEAIDNDEAGAEPIATSTSYTSFPERAR